MADRPRLKFDYIKSSQFRVVHADGAWGGITPRGGVFLTLYCERPPIPQQTVHEISDSMELGPELPEERVARDAVIREAEVGVLMDLVTAKALHRWLDDKIKTLDALSGPSPKIAGNPVDATTEPQR